MTAAAPTRTFPVEDFRHVLGHFATGVAAITAHDGRRPLGFACQSLVSLSLDPPYVSFCPARTSTSWPKLRVMGRLCVNVLAHDQQHVCVALAGRGGDKFRDLTWSPAGNGAPAVEGSLARIEVTVAHEYDAGDHTIVLARVTALAVLRDAPPLLFYRGRYTSVDP